MMQWAYAAEWLLLDSGSGNYAFNMAMDEAMLEAMPRLQRPLLRFYGWNQPAASFGYFQRIQEIQKLTLLRPLVRRPTGGGLVSHDADWTYSVVIPTTDPWYGINARESYRRMHEWIQQSLQRLGLPTELAPCCRKVRPGQCFAGYEIFDLLWHERKIAGAAQRRMRQGLLIQGSIQPPSAAGSREKWQQNMADVASHAGVQWSKLTPDTVLLKRATELAEQKYSATSYNEKR